jgi:hypothetical protein
MATGSGMLLNIKKPSKLRPCATQQQAVLNMDFSRPIVCDTAKMEWFPSHGGEEIYLISGNLRDDSGSYPAGS